MSLLIADAQYTIKSKKGDTMKLATAYVMHALIYVLIGVAFGLYMAANQNQELKARLKIIISSKAPSK